MAKTKEFIKLGFGFGVGSILATLIFVGIGMGLFIGGYIMYMKEKKSETPLESKKIIGIVLMGLGCLIGLGFGAPVLLSSIGDMVE